MEEPAALNFLAFLKARRRENTSHLFLLGDIFDLWIADHPYFVRRFEPLVREVQRLLAEGVHVHYFEGNHDLYLDSYWQGGLGVHVHGGPKTLVLGRWRVAIEHGDQMDPSDYGYRFLRWLLRTPVVRCLAFSLPSRWINQLGERASRWSRSYTGRGGPSRERETRAKLERHVRKLIKRGEKFEYHISGHVHLVHDGTVEGVRVINLGSWNEGGQIFHLRNDSGQWVSAC